MDDHSEAAATCGDDLVALNVGGTPMTTRRSTLTMTYPDSLLARAFAPDSDPRWRLPRMPDGASFLDLNPVHFSGMLDVLRHGTGALSALEPHVARGVALVADYLNMPALTAACAVDLARREIAAAEPTRVKTVAVVVIEADGSLPVVGFDLCDWSTCRQVTVLDSWPVSKVRAVVAAKVGIEPQCMDVHVCWHRENGSIRPCAHVTLDDCETPFGRVKWRSSTTKNVAGDARWMVRDTRHVPEGEATTAIALAGTSVPFEPRVERVGTAFKRYDLTTATVDRCVIVGVESDATVESALPTAMSRLGMRGDPGSVCVYREYGRRGVERFDRRKPIARVCFAIFWLVEGDAGDAPPTSGVPKPAHLLPPP
ncbi:BTB/POZ domain containing protein [Pandoravirus salinus]|uniref:BTB/POZ domain containing protein n=1 Tax=Pandoravirus salinus TaxID=1349410 RepID=S4VZZ9_9VIRU|nr:BTB/POZ domain-containing protein [Pandoravirus salinus]AGO83405.1 BTB/POZ domain containing protein [Pandoravirus salinus]